MSSAFSGAPRTLLQAVTTASFSSGIAAGLVLLAISCNPAPAFAQTPADAPPSAPPVLSTDQASALRLFLAGQYKVRCYTNVYDPGDPEMGAPPEDVIFELPGIGGEVNVPTMRYTIRLDYVPDKDVEISAGDFSFPVYGSASAGIVLRLPFVDDLRWRKTLTWSGVRKKYVPLARSTGLEVVPMGADGLLTAPMVRYRPDAPANGLLADSILWTRPRKGKDAWGIAVLHHELVVWPVLQGGEMVLRGEYRSILWKSHTFQYADTVRGEIELVRVAPSAPTGANGQAAEKMRQQVIAANPWLAQAVSHSSPPAFLGYRYVSGGYQKRDGGIADGKDPPYLENDTTGARIRTLCNNMVGGACLQALDEGALGKTTYERADYTGRGILQATGARVSVGTVCVLKDAITKKCLKYAGTDADGPASRQSITPIVDEQVGESDVDFTLDEGALTTLRTTTTAAVRQMLCRKEPASDTTAATRKRIEEAYQRCLTTGEGLVPDVVDQTMLRYLDSMYTATCARYGGSPGCDEIQAVKHWGEGAELKRCELAEAMGQPCLKTGGVDQVPDASTAAPGKAPLSGGPRLAPDRAWRRNEEPYTSTKCSAGWFPDATGWAPKPTTPAVITKGALSSQGASSLEFVKGGLQGMSEERLEMLKSWWARNCGSAPFPTKTTLSGLRCADSATVNRPPGL